MFATRALIFGLACLPCSGLAHRQPTTKTGKSSDDQASALTKFLFAFNPTAAFNLHSSNSLPSRKWAYDHQRGLIMPQMMPLGVPKVPYRFPGPGQNYADWVDLYNRLYRERILFLGGQVDDELANQLIGIMLYLDSEDANKQISMFINSPGGSVNAGLGIFDTMRHIKSDVSTINIGLAASMGSFLLAAGTKGKRGALPHSRTMIHQPAAGQIQGQASDLKIAAEQILTLKSKLVRYYGELTGQPLEKVEVDLDRDNFLSAQEAVEYGLVDRVIQGKDMGTLEK